MAFFVLLAFLAVAKGQIPIKPGLATNQVLYYQVNIPLFEGYVKTDHGLFYYDPMATNPTCTFCSDIEIGHLEYSKNCLKKGSKITPLPTFTLTETATKNLCTQNHECFIMPTKFASGCVPGRSQVQHYLHFGKPANEYTPTLIYLEPFKLLSGEYNEPGMYFLPPSNPLSIYIIHHGITVFDHSCDKVYSNAVVVEEETKDHFKKSSEAMFIFSASPFYLYATFLRPGAKNPCLSDQTRSKVLSDDRPRQFFFPKGTQIIPKDEIADPCGDEDAITADKTLTKDTWFCKGNPGVIVEKTLLPTYFSKPRKSTFDVGNDRKKRSTETALSTQQPLYEACHQIACISITMEEHKTCLNVTSQYKIFRVYHKQFLLKGFNVTSDSTCTFLNTSIDDTISITTDIGTSTVTLPNVQGYYIRQCKGFIMYTFAWLDIYRKQCEENIEPPALQVPYSVALPAAAGLAHIIISFLLFLIYFLLRALVHFKTSRIWYLFMFLYILNLLAAVVMVAYILNYHPGETFVRVQKRDTLPDSTLQYLNCKASGCASATKAVWNMNGELDKITTMILELDDKTSISYSVKLTEIRLRGAINYVGYSFPHERMTADIYSCGGCFYDRLDVNLDNTKAILDNHKPFRDVLDKAKTGVGQAPAPFHVAYMGYQTNGVCQCASGSTTAKISAITFPTNDPIGFGTIDSEMYEYDIEIMTEDLKYFDYACLENNTLFGYKSTGKLGACRDFCSKNGSIYECHLVTSGVASICEIPACTGCFVADKQYGSYKPESCSDVCRSVSHNDFSCVTDSNVISISNITVQKTYVNTFPGKAPLSTAFSCSFNTFELHILLDGIYIVTNTSFTLASCYNHRTDIWNQIRGDQEYPCTYLKLVHVCTGETDVVHSITVKSKYGTVKECERERCSGSPPIKKYTVFSDTGLTDVDLPSVNGITGKISIRPTSYMVKKLLGSKVVTHFSSMTTVLHDWDYNSCTDCASMIFKYYAAPPMPPPTDGQCLSLRHNSASWATVCNRNKYIGSNICHAAHGTTYKAEILAQGVWSAGSGNIYSLCIAPYQTVERVIPDVSVVSYDITKIKLQGGETMITTYYEMRTTRHSDITGLLYIDKTGFTPVAVNPTFTLTKVIFDQACCNCQAGQLTAVIYFSNQGYYLDRATVDLLLETKKVMSGICSGYTTCYVKFTGTISENTLFTLQIKGTSLSTAVSCQVVERGVLAAYVSLLTYDSVTIGEGSSKINIGFSALVIGLSIGSILLFLTIIFMVRFSCNVDLCCLCKSCCTGLAISQFGRRSKNWDKLSQ